MSKAQLDRFRRQTDAEIEAAVASDPDAAPIIDPRFWKNVRLVAPIGKEPTSIRLDADVLAWFKESGKGYQTRINAVLRTYVDAQRKGAKAARR